MSILTSSGSPKSQVEVSHTTSGLILLLGEVGVE